MAARLSSVRFGNSQKLARMLLCLGGGALMLAATAQPGFAATADAPAIVSPAAAAGSGSTLADARPVAAPVLARTAAAPATARRPRMVKPASSARRLRRVPAMIAASPYRAGCSWFVCGRQMTWLFLGVGF